MDFIVDWIKDWGYWAVFLGATVEGESIILTASALAALGYLSITKIMVVVFFTTTIVDQILFFVGRYYGVALFDRFPRFKTASDRAFRLLHRFDFWFILSFRFIYGLRTISSVVIGAANVSPARFIPLNILSGFLWTVISCMGGYILGERMFNMFHSFEQFQKYLFVGLLLGLGVLFMVIHYRRKKK